METELERQIPELVQAALIIGCRKGARLADKFISHTEAERLVGSGSQQRITGRILKVISLNPPVSGSSISALNEIENAMERWHLARDNDDETLEEINKILVGIGRLGWFNKNKC